MHHLRLTISTRGCQINTSQKHISLRLCLRELPPPTTHLTRDHQQLAVFYICLRIAYQYQGGVLIEKSQGSLKCQPWSTWWVYDIKFTAWQQKSVFLKHQILKFQILIVMDRKFKKDPFWIRFGNIVCILYCANQGFCSTFIIEK